MFFWTPYPFVRLAIFFISGILLGVYHPWDIELSVAVTVFGVLSILYILLAITKRVNPGFVGLVAIVSAGYLNTWFATDSNYQDHILHQKKIDAYQVVVEDYAEEKDKSWKVTGKVVRIWNRQIEYPVRGRVLLYYSKNDFEQPPRYGDQLLIRGSPQPIAGAANPGEFDYKRFLTFRKIYHQHFIRKEKAQLIDHAPPNKLVAFSMQLRKRAEAVLDKHIAGVNERAVAGALILGIKDGLDNELVHAYAASGAMHVLAVSGLHVGIIYVILLFLLRPLQYLRHNNLWIASIAITVLWGYALITGLSPSVLRAVTMFSFIAVARALNYRTNIYNVLAVSAFALLLYEPYLIMSVGFQLSFLAVIGIVYIQPRLYNFWTPKSILLDKVWAITCVSIAAQAATFSLGVLYFHQFPSYFLVSNLFVIPGALMVLVTGIVLLAVSPVQAISSIVGFVLEKLLWVMNYLVSVVEQLPFSLIDNIYITTFQSWLLIGFVVFALALFHFRKFEFAVAWALCGVLFSFLQWNHHLEESNRPKFIVYRVSGQHAMEWIDRGTSYFKSDSLLVNDKERIRFHIRPSRLINNVNRTVVNEIPFAGSWGDYTVYHYKDRIVVHLASRTEAIHPSMRCHYLVISNNAIQNLNQLNGIQSDMIIIDSSNSFFIGTKLLKEASAKGLKVHSVLHDGAFLTYL